MDDDFGRRLIALLPRLRRFAMGLCRSPVQADDLVQSACVKAIGGRSGWQEGSNFDAWMFRILRNTWLDLLRRQRTEGATEVLDDVPGLAGDRGEPDMEARLMLDRVSKAIGRLPDELREVVLLVCVEDLTYKDTAGVLGIPIGTVMSRLARARLRLAEATGYVTAQR